MHVYDKFVDLNVCFVLVVAALETLQHWMLTIFRITSLRIFKLYFVAFFC